jgi:hypothetical protein
MIEGDETLRIPPRENELLSVAFKSKPPVVVLHDAAKVALKELIVGKLKVMVPEKLR